MNLTLDDIRSDIEWHVRQALNEDIGENWANGDITAQLIPAERMAHARIISRDHATIAGRAWVNETFRLLDPSVEITWLVADGDKVEPNQTLFELKGSARSLLTGERCALNFLQTLSAVATKCTHYADRVAHTQVKLLDTRKTLPGLRTALKYAVTQGRCHNHRIGLYDAFLKKTTFTQPVESTRQSVKPMK